MTNTTQFPDLGAQLSKRIIGAAIEVHKHMGAGLLESVYEECLDIEMQRAGLTFERQKVIPIIYQKQTLKNSFRSDFIVEDKVIIELKAVDRILPIHEAQLLTYMKLSGVSLGLIMNFNTVLLKDGIKRMALSKS